MNRQINYKAMRVVIGVIALLLSPVVYFLANSTHPLNSISVAYWTDSRDIFVGSLIAVGFFLFAYNGAGGENNRDWEYYLSKAACVFAICIAIFPTSGFEVTDVPGQWVTALADSVNLQTITIHYWSAVLLFVCLIVMMWFFSNRAKSKGKTQRAYFYRSISSLMLLGIIVIYLYGRMSGSSNTVLLIEVWGLTLWGIGWLAAGIYKTEDI